MNIMKITLSYKRFLASVVFSHNGFIYSAPALIDTGCSVSCIPASAIYQDDIKSLTYSKELDIQLARNGIIQETECQGAGAHKFKVYQHTFNDFKLGDFNLGSLNINVDYNVTSGGYVLIGMDILQKFTILTTYHKRITRLCNVSRPIRRWYICCLYT